MYPAPARQLVNSVPDKRVVLDVIRARWNLVERHTDSSKRRTLIAVYLVVVNHGENSSRLPVSFSLHIARTQVHMTSSYITAAATIKLSHINDSFSGRVKHSGSCVCLCALAC